MSKLKYGEFSFPTPTARPSVSGYARGGKAPTKGQAKVAKVMGEFKRGDLHSGSAKGPIVKNPKQAMAIALSEKKAAGYKDGGNAKKGEKSAKLVGMKREPEAIVKKEVALLKKAGAPAKLIKHEEREMVGLKDGGKAKYQQGGDVDDKGYRQLSFDEAKKVWSHPEHDPKMSANAQYEKLYDQRGHRRLNPAQAKKVYEHPKYDPNLPANAQYEKLFGDKYKKGGKVCYQDGGDVRQMVKENARAKNAAPAKRGAGQMTERERMMMEQARGEKMDRQMRDAERQHYERERMENEADRRAVGDALMYIPRKIGEGARSAYDAVMGKKKGGSVHEDVAMDKKVISKAVHKHEAAMHPGKPMTKLKKGGQPKKLEVGGYLMSADAPASPTGSAANAPSQMASLAQKYADQAAAARPSSFAPPMNQAGVAGRPSGLSGVARGMSRNPAPGGRFPAPPMNQAGAAARATGKVPAYATQSAAPAMKKGGSVKKGVPVHNRTPKC
jgi:hypothetical protein